MLQRLMRGWLAARYNDAQAMLAIGKTALARGLPTEQYAFPEIGAPSYRSIAPSIDKCIVYSIVRTESAFDQRDRSPANAVGLMQVTPEAGRDTAKRFGVAYDWKRLMSDPVYNMQMGACRDQRSVQGIHWFLHHDVCWATTQAAVAYSNGWRNTAIRAIPRSMPSTGSSASRWPETRNYVQRVMENLQVYRARFGNQHHDGRAQFTPSGDDRVTRHGVPGNTCRGRVGRGHAHTDQFPPGRIMAYVKTTRRRIFRPVDEQSARYRPQPVSHVVSQT